MKYTIDHLPEGYERMRMIDTLRKDFLPEGRLPTMKEIEITLLCPQEADSRLLVYCYFRPELASLLEAVERMEELSEQ